MYKISDIISESTKNPSGYTHLTQKIKIEGYNRWLNYYRFRLCTKQEKRSLSLGNIFGEKNEVAEVDLKTRKIDKMSDIDKKKTIINCIFSFVKLIVVSDFGTSISKKNVKFVFSLIFSTIYNFSFFCIAL